MIEAKGATGWTNKQMKSKADRMIELFGKDGGKWPKVIPHYILMSPRPQRDLNLSSWQEWVKNGNEAYWLQLVMPDDLIKPTRCDKKGEVSIDGNYWKIKR